MTYNKLTAQESHIIEDGGTEAPFSGEYDDFFTPGIFVCRRCDQPLYSSRAKFDAGCGWPAFDDCYPNSIKIIPTADGNVAEIRCQKCDGHLGHIFYNEHLTDKNVRHCVNSLSIKFIEKK